MYNKKDIIRLNQEIGENGDFHNESSLDYALHIVRAKKSWLLELSYIARSLLIDHSFQDGNKRTAYLLCALYFEDHKKEYGDFALIVAMDFIAKKNINDINKIQRVLEKCMTR
jgi:hypothetical protein